MSGLPVWATVGRAYGATFRNRGMLLRIGLVWLLLVLAAGLMTGIVTVVIDAPKAFGDVLALAIVAIAMAATAVTWQRAVLLGLRPAGWFSLALDGRVCRYFAVGVGLMITFYIALFFARLILAAAGTGGQAVGLAAAVIAIVGATWVFIRLVLKFPAIAIDDAAMTFDRSWRLTRGNTLRLWLGIVVCLAPMIVGLHVLGFVFASATALDARILQLTLGVMMIALAFLEAGILGAFLSFAYIALVPDDQQAAAGVNLSADAVPVSSP